MHLHTNKIQNNFKMKKNLIQIGLTIAIIVLAYFVYESIMQPIRFNKERAIREAKVIERLKDIRTAQVSFKSVYNQYANDFDTLTNFLKTGKLPLVLKIGDVDDSTAVIIRDTTWVPVFDSIFKNRNISFLDSLPFIPYAEGEKFSIRADKIERSRVVIPVFEVFAAYEQFLKGLKFKNIVDPKEGLKIGSMDSPSIDGNWE